MKAVPEINEVFVKIHSTDNIDNNTRKYAK